MKRSIALLLALLMVLALAPGAEAAMPKLTAADVLPMTAAPDRLAPMELPSASDGYTCWIEPRFETYGQAAVIGREMSINYWANTQGLGDDNGYVGLMIYMGTYDSLTDTSEPVAMDMEEVTAYPKHNLNYMWNTEGCVQGDYTALFFVADQDMNVIAASAADLYLSKTEIPLKSIDTYVYELNDTPDEMYASLDSSGCGYSIGILYEPYHTTVNRWVKASGTGYDLVGESNKADMAELRGFSAPFDPGELWEPSDLTVTYIGEGPFADGVTACEDTIHIVFKPEAEVVHFEKNMTRVCMGGIYQIPVFAPENTGEIMVINGNPYALEILDARDGYITLQALTLDRSEISVCADGAWDRMEIWPQWEHSWTTEESSPTCTEAGYSRSRCSDCGMIANEVIVPALGHDVAEPVVITEPTATKDGVGTGHCSRCDQDVEVVISRIFIDTKPGKFYSEALDYCYANGIINGMSANTFGPDHELNRGQLVTMLHRLAGSPAVEGESPFADVHAGAYYADAVIWANRNGIVMGYDDGTFRPDEVITREQIVTMLHRYVVMLEKDNGARDDLSAFTDLDMLHSYALEPMQWAVANGVVNGMSETVLGPRGYATRAQTVTMLHRIIIGILEAE